MLLSQSLTLSVIELEVFGLLFDVIESFDVGEGFRCGSGVFFTSVGEVAMAVIPTSKFDDAFTLHEGVMTRVGVCLGVALIVLA